jgi:hypothetical protein
MIFKLIFDSRGVNCQTAELIRAKGFCEVYFNHNDRHILAAKGLSRQRSMRLQKPQLRNCSLTSRQRPKDPTPRRADEASESTFSHELRNLQDLIKGMKKPMKEKLDTKSEEARERHDEIEAKSVGSAESQARDEVGKVAKKRSAMRSKVDRFPRKSAHPLKISDVRFGQKVDRYPLKS